MWSGWDCQSALPTLASMSNYYLNIRTVHYIQPLLFLEAFLDHCAFHSPPLLNFYKVRVHEVQTSSKCPFYLSWTNQTLLLSKEPKNGIEKHYPADSQHRSSEYMLRARDESHVETIHLRMVNFMGQPNWAMG